MAPEGVSPLPDAGAGVAGEQLRLLADANIIGIVVATMDGIVEANDAFLAMIGYTRETFAGPIDWQALTPPEYVERDQLALEELRVRGSCNPFEKELWRQDGTRVPVQIGAALLEPEPLRWICFVHDVSAQKQLERDLRQAAEASEMTSRAKDDFANMLVHELRQPIATIAMATSIIRSKLEGDPAGAALRRPLELLEGQITNLTRLTDELLFASRIVRGAMPMRRTEVDLAALVAAVIDDERVRADAVGLSVRLDLPSSAVVVNGDHLRLQHVVANLVGNAIKYTHPGGGIVVTLIAGDALCELHVRDTGIGIPVQELPYVFEPFRRATREGSGFGLGLAVVRSVVEQHGGSVTIASDGPDTGTEVVVTLPVAARR